MYCIFVFKKSFEKETKEHCSEIMELSTHLFNFGECPLCAESGKPLGKYEILILVAQSLTEEQRGEKKICKLCLPLRWRKIKMCIYVGGWAGRCLG